MSRPYRGMKNRRSGESGSFWLSFSDMMSVLVLIFIFVIFTMMFTLQEHEDDLKKTRDEYEIAMLRASVAEEENQRMVIVLGEARADLAAAQADLENANEQLTLISGQLEESSTIILDLRSKNEELSAENAFLLQQKQMLEDNSSALDSQIALLQSEIDRKRAEYSELETEYGALLIANGQNAALIAQYESDLSGYREELEQTQAQLEQTLGIRAQIIRRLSQELRRNNISVEVDPQTGAIILPGAMLFDSGKTDLKESAANYLDSFLRVYLSVLMSDEFKPYISEIIIEGHTDSTGKNGMDPYLYNLELSQQRALSVANYVLDESYMTGVLRLDRRSAAAFRKMISAAGRSYSDLKYNADGSENKEASRRVEIKFSLNDEESVAATMRIINN